MPRRLLPDDEAITAAIRAAGGVTTAAAEALGVSPHRLSSYLSAHPGVWPEGVERRRDSAVSDDDVTNALRAAQGRIADAARALGVPRHMVTARLRRHPGVWPSDTPRPRATDAEVAAARGYPAFVFRSKVQTAYRQTCVVCGLRFPKSSHCPVPGVDAAHIQPWSKVDLDTLANGLCLCKMHHWAFDQRLIAIRPDPSGQGYVVIVTETAARALAADPASLAALEAHAGPIPRGRLPAAIADWPSVALLERFYEAVRPDLE